MQSTAFTAQTLTPEQTQEQFNSNLDGLSQAEAASRQAKFGANKLPEAKTIQIWQLFLHQFSSPLIFILLFAAGVSVLLEEHAGAIFIMAVLLVNAVIGSIQEYSANRSASALNKLVLAPCRVKRDQKTCTISTQDLVPGDIVLLQSGDKVPADLRLLSSQNLLIDEAMLTGESLHISKHAETILAADTPISGQVNMAFAGTIITEGRGLGLVVAIASDTQIGRIAQQINQPSAVSSPLIQRMERFTWQVAAAVAVLIALIAVILFVQGHPWQHIFMLAVGLAVAAIPEGLPVTLTVALAIGMRRMAKRNVIVRKLPAVEALGSCTIIASDKTGTLTENALSVAHLNLANGQQLNPVDYLKARPEAMLLKAATLANEGELVDTPDGRVVEGDAVDGALLQMTEAAGLNYQQLRSDYPLVSSLPYEPQLKYAASMHRHANLDTDLDLVFVKGALEAILPMCSHIQQENQQTTDLHPNQIEQIQQQEQDLSQQQWRALAFAWAQVPKGQELSPALLQGLTYLGLTCMGDPLRPEAQPAIDQCHTAGIQVVMVTGDHPATALAIAEQLHISHDKDEVLSGPQLTQLAAADKQDRIANSKVFARVAPHQKLDIVNHLIDNGEFIAVTGDGVNDAPALRHAHVGVAMGKGGTDVARESADIILTDDNFASIVEGIKQGRLVYANIRKIIYFLLATSMAEVGMFLGAITLGLPLPLIATQLLWLNFATSIIQDLAHAFNPPEGNELQQPPRPPKESIFDRSMLRRIGITAFAMGVISLIEFYWLVEHWQYGIDAARNLLLLQFVLFENVIVLNSMSETASFWQQKLWRNPLLVWGTLLAQALHIGAMYTPWLQNVLHIQPVSLMEWSGLLGMALVVMLVIELEKWWARRYL